VMSACIVTFILLAGANNEKITLVGTYFVNPHFTFLLVIAVMLFASSRLDFPMLCGAALACLLMATESFADNWMFYHNVLNEETRWFMGSCNYLTNPNAKACMLQKGLAGSLMATSLLLVVMAILAASRCYEMHGTYVQRKRDKEAQSLLHENPGSVHDVPTRIILALAGLGAFFFIVAMSSNMYIASRVPADFPGSVLNPNFPNQMWLPTILCFGVAVFASLDTFINSKSNMFLLVVVSVGATCAAMTMLGYVTRFSETPFMTVSHEAMAPCAAESLTGVSCNTFHGNGVLVVFVFVFDVLLAIVSSYTFFKMGRA